MAKKKRDRKHSRKIASKVAIDGGITVGPEPGDRPIEVGNPNVRRYITGGAPNPAAGGRRFPETVVSLSQFGPSHTMEYMGHARAARSAGMSNAYVGGWTEPASTPEAGTNAVMDVSTVHTSVSDALMNAARRGERAVFATAGVEDIPTPRAPWTSRPGFAARHAEGEIVGQGYLFRPRFRSEEVQTKELADKISDVAQDVKRRGI